MKRATAIPLLAACLLAGCGGRADEAATVCEAAVAERLPDQQYTLDREGLATSAADQGDNVLQLQSSIVFKPGMPGEYTQQVECKVRFGAAPDVISLTFYY